MAGDFTINLLHTNYVNKEHFSDFLGLMLGYSIFLRLLSQLDSAITGTHARWLITFSVNYVQTAYQYLPEFRYLEYRITVMFS